MARKVFEAREKTDFHFDHLSRMAGFFQWSHFISQDPIDVLLNELVTEN